ncbi:AAA family ATPase [Olleya marilimosa]|uniref:AAA family ATPase n=1 Tax=Olleya marilimosa TaxID=272164 RepID=UPI001CD1367F|nr:AAA family ATPase [Olleya marilimosa]
MIIDYIEIEGYKSIKKTKLELKPINILIGSNGSGKSNFISFFEFLNQLYEQKLEEYIALRGGQEKMLYQGLKTTVNISAHLSFNSGVNGYSFTLTSGDDKMIFTKENLWYHDNPWSMASYTPKAGVKFNKKGRGEYVNRFLRSFRKYHFHDTGKNSPFSETSHVDNDSFFLYEEGSNLAAFLNSILNENKIVYNRIIQTIQSIAPYFSDFFFQPNEKGYLRLQWQSKYSSTVYGANDLSDGTLRFIALTTLFLQPNLPNTIIIDEPELGLHPFAIAKLAGMIKSVSLKNVQVILATQSADLINHFSADNIITVDQFEGESVFNRLDEANLKSWLEEYNIGDLWQKNIIKGGQPNR